MTQWTWERLQKLVKINGQIQSVVGKQCAQAAKKIGLSVLPPSYCHYVSLFGLGEWQPDFLITVPSSADKPISLCYSIAKYRKATQQVLSECRELVKQPEVLERLLCIGGSGNGYDLCWDPSTQMPNGEMNLCIVTHEESDIVSCGSDLLEFLGTYWIDGKIDEACPLGGSETWNTRAEFRVLDEN